MKIRQHTIETPWVVGPVHCYSTEVDGELVLFDTGPHTDIGKRYLLEKLDFARLKYIFITHCHVDHYGLAYWLERKSGAKVFIPRRDYQKIVYHQERIDIIARLLADMGFSKDFLAASQRVLLEKVLIPDDPHRLLIVEDDFPTILGFDFMNCPGHSQSDIVYYHERWAVTGDILLRGIFQSPLLDVDLDTGERFLNYHAYCSSLKKLATLRGKKIFPGHRKRITTVDETILFYVSKLLDRIAYLQPLTKDESVARIIERRFAKLLTSPLHTYLKASELIFMLDFLEEPQRIKNALEVIGLFSGIEEKFNAITA